MKISLKLKLNTSVKEPQTGLNSKERFPKLTQDGSSMTWSGKRMMAERFPRSASLVTPQMITLTQLASLLSQIV
jgi:hypothetical protein